MPPKRMRVLIIEDSLDAGYTASYLLRHSGHSVELAINGYAALSIAEWQRPEVVLLDIGLPDFDGVALVKRLKKIPGLQGTRFIAITGRVSDDDEARAIGAGCERFLRKPVDPTVLEAMVNGDALH
jgi:CheY-like chemotaxis protein